MAASRTRDAASQTGQPRPDAYTGMLIVSLLATVTGLIFLLLDYSSYPEKEAPKPPQLAAPRLAPPAQPSAAKLK
jgi:hypothetical protein